MLLPLREIEVMGMLVDPATALLFVCVAAFMVLRLTIDRFVDLNRYVWRRPFVDLAIFVLMYSLAILTLKPQ